jgi:hypothetical protein
MRSLHIIYYFVKSFFDSSKWILMLGKARSCSTQKKLFQKMCSRNITKSSHHVFQAKMTRCLGQKKEHEGGRFPLVFVAQGPCYKYLGGKNKSQHPSRLSLMWTWNRKTIMHRFWQCPRVKTWEQAFSFLYSLKSPIDVNSAWRPLNLEQCMFDKKVLN